MNDSWLLMIRIKVWAMRKVIGHSFQIAWASVVIATSLIFTIYAIIVLKGSINIASPLIQVIT